MLLVRAQQRVKFCEAKGLMTSTFWMSCDALLSWRPRQAIPTRVLC
jgi:hypothetical protein